MIRLNIIKESYNTKIIRVNHKNLSNTFSIHLYSQTCISKLSLNLIIKSKQNMKTLGAEPARSLGEGNCNFFNIYHIVLLSQCLLYIRNCSCRGKFPFSTALNPHQENPNLRKRINNSTYTTINYLILLQIF